MKIVPRLVHTTQYTPSERKIRDILIKKVINLRWTRPNKKQRDEKKKGEKQRECDSLWWIQRVQNSSSLSVRVFIAYFAWLFHFIEISQAAWRKQTETELRNQAVSIWNNPLNNNNKQIKAVKYILLVKLC